MRVAIVSEWFSRGAGYVSRQYREVLEAQGHEVFIYSRGDQHLASGTEWQDEHVYRGAPCRIGRPKAIYAPDYLAWLTRVSPEIVIFNEQHWLPPVLWTRNQGIPTAAYVDYYTHTSISSFEWYDVLLCNTRRHISAFGWHLGSHYLPWGTDLQRFSPASRPSRPVTFLHSAGWDPERKGTEQVLRCWLSLKGDSRLIVHSQADVSSIVESFACRPEIESGALTILTGTTDPSSLYELGDVYVYPTHLDGIGLTIVEAVASGLPVIVPDDGPMNEFCLDGISTAVPLADRYRREDGYFWPCNKIADLNLISAMEWFANASDQQVEGWRYQCRKTALEKFDWSRNSMGLSTILSNAELHSVDRNIVRAGGRVRPRLAKFESLGGRIAAGIIGGRDIRNA
jgi:1,2-diacylglycerol 3-alpha-glucosyltransferase